MISHSTSLKHRLERETIRHAGSNAVLLFYAGDMPASCEDMAEGERIAHHATTEMLVRRIAEGTEPPLPEGASYWRLMSNEGNCVMQGDGK